MTTKFSMIWNGLTLIVGRCYHSNKQKKNDIGCYRHFLQQKLSHLQKIINAKILWAPRKTKLSEKVVSNLTASTYLYLWFV